MNQTPEHIATHELRTWPGYFQQTWLGRKTFDVRLDDRGFTGNGYVVLAICEPQNYSKPAPEAPASHTAPSPAEALAKIARASR